MITGIRLRNWKSHLDSEFSFSRGVNGIVGIMGSGKSSIMQAISFALFGTFSGLSSRRVNLDDLIMIKPQKKDFTEVELSFSAGEDEYTVRRRIERGKGTAHAEIRKGGEMVEVNPRDVTEQVVGILQTDHDLFSKAVYSEQNGLDYFLNIPKGKRMAQIDGMLKLDLYENARENSVKLRNRMASAREEKVKIIEDMKAKNLEERIEKIESEIQKKKKEAGKAGRELEKISGERKDILDKHDKAREKTEELRKRISELNGKIMFLKNQNEEIREKAEDAKEKKEEIKKLKKDLGSDPEKRIKKLKKEIEKIKENMHRNRALSGQAGKSLEELEESGDKCPVCDSDISGGRKNELVKERKETISKLSRETEKLSKEAEEKEEERDDVSGRYDKLRENEMTLKEMGGGEKGLAENEKKMEEMRKQVSETAEKIKSFGESEKELSEKLSDMNERYGELRSRKEGTEEIIESKNSVLEDLRKDYDAFVRYGEEVRKYRKIDERLGKFIGILGSTQDQLREEFLKTVNSIMASVWGELYPYGDFQEIRLSIEKDYVLQLRGSSGWTSVDLVSGGERTMASLALRMAFSLAFAPNLRWLILDEPTHNLDSNAIRHFGNILRDKMGNFIDQVFLITHEESLSDYVTGSLYRMERDKEMDGVTKVAVA